MFYPDYPQGDLPANKSSPAPTRPVSHMTSPKNSSTAKINQKRPLADSADSDNAWKKLSVIGAGLGANTSATGLVSNSIGPGLAANSKSPLEDLLAMNSPRQSVPLNDRQLNSEFHKRANTYSPSYYQSNQHFGIDTINIQPTVNVGGAGQSRGDNSFSFQIDAEKEYVQRLRQQREKIELLYSHYDRLLAELSQKDTILHQKQQQLSDLDGKYQSAIPLLSEVQNLRMDAAAMRQQLVQRQGIIEQLNQSYKHALDEVESKGRAQQTYIKHLEAQLGDMSAKMKLFTEILQEKANANLSCEQTQQLRYETLQMESTKCKEQLTLSNNELRRQLLSLQEAYNCLKIEQTSTAKRLAEASRRNDELAANQEVEANSSNKELNQLHSYYNAMLSALRHTITASEAKCTRFMMEIQQGELLKKDLVAKIQAQAAIYEDTLHKLRIECSRERTRTKEIECSAEQKLRSMESDLKDCMRREASLRQQLGRLQGAAMAKRNLQEVSRKEIEKIQRLVGVVGK